jgi:hypothetical protein
MIIERYPNGSALPCGLSCGKESGMIKKWYTGAKIDDAIKSCKHDIEYIQGNYTYLGEIGAGMNCDATLLRLSDTLEQLMTARETFYGKSAAKINASIIDNMRAER